MNDLFPRARDPRGARADDALDVEKQVHIDYRIHTAARWTLEGRGACHAGGRPARAALLGEHRPGPPREDRVRAQARRCIARAGSTVDRRSKPAASPPAQVRVSLEATVHSKRWSKRVPLDASSSHRRARFQINPRRRPSLSLSKTAARERSTLARSSPPSAHFRLLLEVVTAEPCRRAPSGEFG